MFHTGYFRFQLFHINKFINGKGLLSNWQRLSTIYGEQFSTIRNRNGRSCIIQYKYQKFCQCNQFCSGNDLHSLPVEKPNSSSIISSSQMSINNVIRQNKQPQHSAAEGTEKRSFEIFETRWLGLDIHNKKQLKIELAKGRSGHKYFKIHLFKNVRWFNFIHILVPEDAYAFVRALDELIGEFAAEDFEQKLRIQDPKSTIEIVKDGRRKRIRASKLKIVELSGQQHKIHLELALFPEMHNSPMEICLGFSAMQKIYEHNTWLPFLPLQALPWLRKQMAEMLAKHDGTEQIEKEAPTQIPKQFFARGDIPPASTIRNCISSSGYNLNQKVVQPPFANKMPTSFQKYSKISATKMQNSNHIGQQKPNLKKRPKMTNKNSIIERLEPQPQKTALEHGIRTLFDFDDEEMENYRRIAAKVKYPTRQ